APAPNSAPQPKPIELPRVEEAKAVPGLEPTPIATTPVPTPVPAPVAAPAPVVKEPEPPRTVTIASGTTLRIRLGEMLASDRNKDGDAFHATLDQPLVVDGLVIAERGSRALGRIVELEEAGRVKGLARLSLELTSFDSSDGQKISIRTAR